MARIGEQPVARRIRGHDIDVRILVAERLGRPIGALGGVGAAEQRGHVPRVVGLGFRSHARQTQARRASFLAASCAPLQMGRMFMRRLSSRSAACSAWRLPAGLAGAAAEPQQPKVAPAPPRQEGDGPYSQLILRNATVINGTGAPAFGPADIVIAGNRIVQVMSVGSPGGVKEAAEAAEARRRRTRDRSARPLRDARAHRHARPHRRRRAGRARDVRLQAVDGPRHHHHPRPGLRQRRRMVRQRREAQRAQRDHRAAHLPVCVLRRPTRR